MKRGWWKYFYFPKLCHSRTPPAPMVFRLGVTGTPRYPHPIYIMVSLWRRYRHRLRTTLDVATSANPYANANFRVRPHGAKFLPWFSLMKFFSGLGVTLINRGQTSCCTRDITAQVDISHSSYLTPRKNPSENCRFACYMAETPAQYHHVQYWWATPVAQTATPGVVNSRTKFRGASTMGSLK